LRTGTIILPAKLTKWPGQVDYGF